MRPLTPYVAELAVNPSACHGADYGPAQTRILNADGLNTAKAIIGAWPGYQPTPLVALAGLARAADVKNLHYKDEAHRFGLKSFKPLGGAFAVARMLIRELPGIVGKADITIDDLLVGRHREAVTRFTVTAATDGNHGRSVAWGARMFGCRCVIFINEAVSEGREKAIASYGAEVRRNPGSYDDAVRKAQATAEAEGWYVIADTSNDIALQAPHDVTQGYAVMAAETIDQLPYGGAPTHIFLQAGVGGMAAATCAQFWQEFGPKRPKTILVEPVNAACWFASLKAGHPVVIDGDLDSLMGGLACGEISHLAWEILAAGADAMMTIEDAAAADCMRLLAEGPYGDPVIVAGESGVAGLAGFLAATQDADMRRTLGLDENSRVVIFGTEGATDPDTYAEIVGHTTEGLTL
jgi:diaminopropionate ammonia-lyase